MFCGAWLTRDLYPIGQSEAPMVSANPRWNSDGSTSGSRDPQLGGIAGLAGGHPCEDPGVKTSGIVGSEVTAETEQAE